MATKVDRALRLMERYKHHKQEAARAKAELAKLLGDGDVGTAPSPVRKRRRRRTKPDTEIKDRIITLVRSRGRTRNQLFEKIDGVSAKRVGSLLNVLRDEGVVFMEPSMVPLKGGGRRLLDVWYLVGAQPRTLEAAQ